MRNKWTWVAIASFAVLTVIYFRNVITAPPDAL
ncbi:unnamed protein product, partial [marine sediment metagenome]